ncbi:MAG: transposase [Patescibacteria group bacterium]
MAVREKTQFIPDQIYYITFTILGWKKIFINDKYCNLVYQWFNYMKSNYDNKIYGYVIMPNHIHVLIKITNKSKKLSVLIFNAKRFMGLSIIKLLKEDKKINLVNYFSLNSDKRANYKLFQPRYDSLIIQSRKFFLEKLNYIHKNPCQEKWNLAEKPEDYKYSSAANYILGKGYYEVDIIDF